MLGLGADRKVLRIYLQRRLFLAGPHPARPRHPRRLRPVEVGDRKAVRTRAPGAPRHGDDGLRRLTASELVMAGLDPAIHVLTPSQQGKAWMPGSSPGMTMEKVTPRMCNDRFVPWR